MRAEGREQGRRALLLRLARVRFGEDVAARLAAPLDGISDSERLDEIGEWLMACDSADALLARI